MTKKMRKFVEMEKAEHGGRIPIAAEERAEQKGKRRPKRKGKRR